MDTLPLSTMTFDDFRTLCFNRRSIRYFSDKKTIDRPTIEKLLNTARLSPSVENIQPWQFHVITNADLKKKIMEYSCYGNFVAGAAVFIVVTCNKASKSLSREPIWNPKEMEYSCAGAMHALMLAATSLGIGSCWVSLHHGPSHNALHLKDNQTVIGGIMLGYLKEGESLPSGEHDRHPISNMVIFHE